MNLVLFQVCTKFKNLLMDWYLLVLRFKDFTLIQRLWCLLKIILYNPGVFFTCRLTFLAAVGWHERFVPWTGNLVLEDDEGLWIWQHCFYCVALQCSRVQYKVFFVQHFGTQSSKEELFCIFYSSLSFSHLFLELGLRTASVTTFSTLPTAVGFEVLSKEPWSVKASPGQLGAAKWAEEREEELVGSHLRQPGGRGLWGILGKEQLLFLLEWWNSSPGRGQDHRVADQRLAKWIPILAWYLTLLWDLWQITSLLSGVVPQVKNCCCVLLVGYGETCSAFRAFCILKWGEWVGVQFPPDVTASEFW